MSNSVLWGITSDKQVEAVQEFKNSFLFAPPIWDNLMMKYIPPHERLCSYKSAPYDSFFLWSTQSDTPNKVDLLSQEINYYRDSTDLIIWYLSTNCIFRTKDIPFVLAAIEIFLLKSNETKSPKLPEHCRNRLIEIHNAISKVNGEKYLYFMLQGTDVSDSVDNWFSEERKAENIQYNLVDISLVNNIVNSYVVQDTIVSLSSLYA